MHDVMQSAWADPAARTPSPTDATRRPPSVMGRTGPSDLGVHEQNEPEQHQERRPGPAQERRVNGYHPISILFESAPIFESAGPLLDRFGSKLEPKVKPERR